MAYTISVMPGLVFTSMGLLRIQSLVQEMSYPAINSTVSGSMVSITRNYLVIISARMRVEMLPEKMILTA
ncbi:MAG: SulP family inorganic anion transporter [Anaerolineales bacterium]